jgi:hypothetical protein
MIFLIPIPLWLFALFGIAALAGAFRSDAALSAEREAASAQWLKDREYLNALQAFRDIKWREEQAQWLKEVSKYGPHAPDFEEWLIEWEARWA